MSVSALDTPVSAPPAPDAAPVNTKPDAKAMHAAPAAPSYTSQSTVNVNFHLAHTHSRPVFGDQQHQAHNHSNQHRPGGYNNPSALPNLALQQGFVQQLTQLLGNWFGGHRPPHLPGSGGPPATPNTNKPGPALPGRPDLEYATKNNEELAQQLLQNFNAFKDPKKPRYVSTDSIQAMANKRPSGDAVMNQNIRLAKELLRRPDLINAIDRGTTTGALDGLIDKQQLSLILDGDNVFKYTSNKQLADEMLEHFDALKGQFGRELKFKSLQRLAAQPLTRDADKDHLTHLSREVLTRRNLLDQMDDLASREDDGSISLEALYRLSR
ncbi:type III secretion effector protein [Pseudomonas kitaguniensis]|uniref:type III secretion effector protein n=1 Tax=Pseudomonas kitaguniensis TaxID=2607908 RepID=UPI003CFDACAC